MGATMNIELAKIFKHKAINEWGLVLVFAVPMCIFNYLAMTDTNIDSPEGLSHMIGYSVRWAVPFIYLVVAASSVKILFPGVFSAWWMRNRKYIGLVFAVGMAWQAAFIFMLSTFHRDYYFSDVYYFRDEVEGSVGYIFLVAMVITSFQFARKRVNHAQWKLIQKGGIYFLWAYPFSVYWWNLFYYPYVDGYSNPELHDYLFYWAGFLAFAMRLFAYGKLRNKALSKSDVNGAPSTASISSRYRTDLCRPYWRRHRKILVRWRVFAGIFPCMVSRDGVMATILALRAFYASYRNGCRCLSSNKGKSPERCWSSH